jgi:hypothetical protein
MEINMFKIKSKDILEYDLKQIFEKNKILDSYLDELILTYRYQKFDFSIIIKWFNFLLLTNLNTLESIGRSISEDICIFTKIDGKFRLIYTIVAFPNRWRPKEKIGKSISELQFFIPKFENTIENVDNFLDFMPEYIPYRSENLEFTNVPDLYLPFDIINKEELYQRKEIQTLIKIENFVIYLIKTDVKKIENKELKDLPKNLSEEYKKFHSKL